MHKIKRSGASVGVAIGGSIMLGAALALPATPAVAHSWYPWECCHDQDCAPVDRVQSLPEQDSMFVTSKVGNAIVPASFPKRESQDGRMHICLAKKPGGGMKLLCVFVPPQS